MVLALKKTVFEKCHEGQNCDISCGKRCRDHQRFQCYLHDTPNCTALDYDNATTDVTLEQMATLTALFYVMYSFGTIII